MNISNKKELEEAIIQLEKRKVIQHNQFQYHLKKTTESLKPGNLVKGAFNGIMHSPVARNGIIKAAAGMGIGLLTKKMFWGNSASLVKRLIGNAVKIGVTKTAISNSDKIKAYASSIYHNLFAKRPTRS